MKFQQVNSHAIGTIAISKVSTKISTSNSSKNLTPNHRFWSQISAEYDVHNPQLQCKSWLPEDSRAHPFISTSLVKIVSHHQPLTLFKNKRDYVVQLTALLHSNANNCMVNYLFSTVKTNTNYY